MFQKNNRQLTLQPMGLFLVTLLSCLLTLAPSTFAQDSPSQIEAASSYDITSNSDRCVVLRQGQVCYKKIKLRWRAPQPGNYCIHNLTTDNNVQCWQQQSNGDLAIEFESDSDTRYVLQQQNSGINLAEFNIKVLWVYEPKPEKPRGWRIF